MASCNLTHIKNITNLFQKFFDKEYIQSVARQVGFFQRKRCLEPFTLLVQLVWGVVAESRRTYSQLIVDMSSAILKTVTTQALSKRFNLQFVELILTLLRDLMRLLKTKNLQTNLTSTNATVLEQFPEVLATDSSTVSLPSKLASVLPGCGGSGSKAGIKWHLTINILTGNLKFWRWTESKKADEIDDEIIYAQKGSLHLFDKGYGQQRIKLAFIHKLHQFFLTPLWLPLPLYNEKGQKIDLDVLIRHARSNNKIKAWLYIGNPQDDDDNEVVPIRLVGFRLPQEIASQRKRRAHEDARRKGRQVKESTLRLKEWNFYITNTSEKQIAPEHMPIIYSLRWQVELTFKRWKSLMGFRKPLYKKPTALFCHILASLLLALFMSLMQSNFYQYWLIHQDREPSPFRLAKLFINAGQIIAKILTSQISQSEKYQQLVIILESIFKLSVMEKRKRKTSRERLLQLKNKEPQEVFMPLS